VALPQAITLRLFGASRNFQSASQKRRRANNAEGLFYHPVHPVNPVSSFSLWFATPGWKSFPVIVSHDGLIA
jgi:hypothetical protein